LICKYCISHGDIFLNDGGVNCLTISILIGKLLLDGKVLNILSSNDILAVCGASVVHVILIIKINILLVDVESCITLSMVITVGADGTSLVKVSVIVTDDFEKA
jgi:hypothetical protein